MRSLNPFLSIFCLILTIIALLTLYTYATYISQGALFANSIMNFLVVFCILNPIIGLTFSIFINEKRVKLLLIIINSIVALVVIPFMIFIAVFRFGFASFV
ncbi:hypothetical protein CHH48_08995 [Terribacillus saccharophilus]|uniref:Uncharacterized protein n=1 Tax=Terribacillus saccharophilus TaxID=361277 RepID=A0ABX4GZ39_9BACI|nr:hypothetical protein CHH56_08470 [Terribacillus saccharophilus]PAD96552.1 hypothetical protein CHH50_08090 [Terribacillus saccharophilus]PAE00128.1 hypothetical protein CHH48_08995 [Terribacillus saccharophilus]